MFRSLFLACTIAGATAFNTSVVSPVRVFFDARTLTGTSADVCNLITKGFDSGATEVILDATKDGVVSSSSFLNVWINEMSDPSGRDCLNRNAGKGNMGITAATTSALGASSFVSQSAKIAKDNGFSFVYWLTPPADCTDDNVNDVAKTIADNVKADAAVDLVVIFSSAYLSSCSQLLPAVDSAVAADKTHLRSIEISYFNQAVLTDRSTIIPFPTYESVFVQSPSAYPGVSISELNAAVTNLKGYFGVQKPMQSSIAKDPTDYIPISTLKTWTCQAQRNATIGYNKGMELAFYQKSSDGDAMIDGGLRKDCDGGDLPGLPNGSGTTLAISAIAVIATAFALLS